MADKLPKSTKVKMTSVDDLFKLHDGSEDAKEQVKVLELSQLHSFERHPFKVLEDEKMQDLIDSIREYGILNPLLVRPRTENEYEMISGHRRKFASEKVGLSTAPCIIREMSDEEAIIHMVDSNIQREELLYSEKAYAYKMKLDAMNRQGKRSDKTSSKNGVKSEDTTLSQFGVKSEDTTSSQFGVKPGFRSDVALAQQVGESKSQIHRYIRLTELLKSLLDRVDRRQIPFGVGVELSYLTLTEQETLLKIMDNLSVVPNLAQATKMKQLSKEKKLDETSMELLLSQEKPLPAAFKLERKKLNNYFPQNFSEEQKEQVIYDLLRKWSNENGYSQDN